MITQLCKFLSLVFCLACATSAFAKQLFSSPDGNLKMDFFLSSEGQVHSTYVLYYKGKTVIKPSGLGFVLKNSDPLLEKFKITTVTNDSLNETWQPVWGEESVIRNHYNEVLVALKQADTNRRMSIRFRLFNDAYQPVCRLPAYLVSVLSDSGELRA